MQDGITDPITKCDMRRAVIRTAALAHWRHHYSPARLVSSLPRTMAGVPQSTPATQLFDDRLRQGAEGFRSVSTFPFHEADNGSA